MLTLPQVRIQLPDDDRLSLQPDGGRTSVAMAEASNMTVWHQPVAAQRIGKYKFKGSAEELTMVYVALEKWVRSVARGAP